MSEMNAHVVVGRQARAKWKRAQADLLAQRWACFHNPNGDTYRAAHLQDIGEDGLKELYADGKITLAELEALDAEMLASEPDPLDAEPQ